MDLNGEGPLSRIPRRSVAGENGCEAGRAVGGVLSGSGSISGRVTRHGLFVDVRGQASRPALLFLHGGPGQGAYDFMAMQGDRLGNALRVVRLDQRGVDRSA